MSPDGAGSSCQCLRAVSTQGCDAIYTKPRAAVEQPTSFVAVIPVVQACQDLQTLV